MICFREEIKVASAHPGWVTDQCRDSELPIGGPYPQRRDREEGRVYLESVALFSICVTPDVSGISLRSIVVTLKQFVLPTSTLKRPTPAGVSAGGLLL